jgi:hypothetical protein
MSTSDKESSLGKKDDISKQKYENQKLKEMHELKKKY